MMQGTQKEYPIVVLPFYTKKQKIEEQEVHAPTDVPPSLSEPELVHSFPSKLLV